MVKEIDIVFALVQGALDGTVPDVKEMETSRWWSLFRLLQQNHVAALTADTMASLNVPREVKIPWLAERDKAERWQRYQREVQQDIIDTMKRHGIETLVLKGTHTAQYYPQPALREFGDLDLYFFDHHDEADHVASEVLKVAVSNDTHHHSKYNYRGVTVESHYNFVNRHYPPSNRRYETRLKELSPSPTFEVLFLLRHMAGHFAASRITLRDLVDWALTCSALQDKVDWATVQNTVAQFGMEQFVATLNNIIAHRLGTQSFSKLDSQRLEYPDIQALIEHDTIYGSVSEHDGDGVSRFLWKLHRWRSLGWKRKMVYNDNGLQLLIASLTSHAAKPQSIMHKS